MKTLKPIALLISMWALSHTSFAQSPGQNRIAETDRFEFFSNYWFNLHHLLYQEALVQNVTNKSVVEEELASMSVDQRSTFNQAVKYYQDKLIKEDLRMSDYMWEFKQWVTSSQNGKSFENIPDQFKAHCELLSKVSNVYEEVFWKRHQASNAAVVEEYLIQIKQVEQKLVERLSGLTRERWQPGKIRVDVSFFAKATPRNLRDRPYTSLRPTHIVMNSRGNAKLKNEWLEMLFHEASHHLIGTRSGFVGGTIVDVAANLDQKIPRDLWHAYLFYFSGVATQEALADLGTDDYQIYMVRRKVFASYIPLLDKYLPDYLNGKVTLAEATKNLIENIK